MPKLKNGKFRMKGPPTANEVRLFATTWIQPRSTVFTDGARAYEVVAAERSWTHHAVSHKKGEWTRTFATKKVHTNKIDCLWAHVHGVHQQPLHYPQAPPGMVHAGISVAVQHRGLLVCLNLRPHCKAGPLILPTTAANSQHGPIETDTAFIRPPSPKNGPYLQLLPPRQNAAYDARFGRPTVPNASHTYFFGISDPKIGEGSLIPTQPPLVGP